MVYPLHNGAPMIHQYISASLLVSAVALGCGGESKANPSGSNAADSEQPAKAGKSSSKSAAKATPKPIAKPTIELTADQKALAAEIESGAKSDSKLYRDERAVVLHLALTSSNDKVVRKMFLEIAKWPRRKQGWVDDTAVAVVRYRITNDARPISPMFVAAKRMLELRDSESDMPFVHDLAAIATDHTDLGARREALRAIRAVRVRPRNIMSPQDDVLATMERAVLDNDSAPVLIAALNVGVYTYDAAQLDDLIVRTIELTKHDDPGVRGEALDHLVPLFYAEMNVDGKLDRDQTEARLAIVEEALSDEHPFVRGKAIGVLPMLFFSPAVLDKLVALVDDPGKVDYAYDFEQAGGGTGRDIGGTGRDTVGSMALEALGVLAAQWSSSGVPEAQSVDMASWTGLTTGDVSAIRSWYAKNKAAIAKAYPAILSFMKSL